MKTNTVKINTMKFNTMKINTAQTDKMPRIIHAKTCDRLERIAPPKSNHRTANPS
jgi:hypothetical protein